MKAPPVTLSEAETEWIRPVLEAELQSLQQLQEREKLIPEYQAEYVLIYSLAKRVGCPLPEDEFPERLETTGAEIAANDHHRLAAQALRVSYSTQADTPLTS